MAIIRVAHMGLGSIGSAVARALVRRPGFKVVGGIDIESSKVGRDLGDVVGLGRLGVKVWEDPVRALRTLKPHVVVVCTGSSLEEVMPQIETVLKAKVPIVSTAEELAYPHYTHVRLARKIDALAKKAKVAVLATGINPGFVMDALPIALTAACERVSRVTVTRVQDARERRLPFQQKIGAGLTTEQFQKRVKEGRIGHVGFTQSIAMIADTLGWSLDRITDRVQPRIAQVTVASEFLAVDPGYVCGIVQEGIGSRDGEPAVRLYMEAYLGAPETYDLIEIDGSPRISAKLTGGIHGDLGTSSIVVNSIRKVIDAKPGLRTMRDMVLPSFEV